MHSNVPIWLSSKNLSVLVVVVVVLAVAFLLKMNQCRQDVSKSFEEEESTV